MNYNAKRFISRTSQFNGKFASQLKNNLLDTKEHFNAIQAGRSNDWNFSIYDMAWVLCTDFFTDQERKQQLNSLLDEQNVNGIWGNSTYLPHSAVIDTLAVMMMLVRLKRPIPNLNKLESGIDQLFQAIITYPHHDTVAFELIAPLLLSWLRDHQIQLNLSEPVQDFIAKITKKGEVKLDFLIDKAGQFNSNSSLSYTAEIAALTSLFDDQHIEKLPNLILANGAIGLSPAATAGVIVALKEHDKPVPEALYTYLKDTYRAYENNGFPDLYPYAHTQRLWSMVPWLLSGNIFNLIKDKDILSIILDMYQEIEFDKWGRVSWDIHNTALPDLDDTSVAFALYAVLVGTGVDNLEPRTSDVFRRFQRKDGSFFCYQHELHPSPVGSLHALMAMDIAAEIFGDPFVADPENKSIRDDLLKYLDPKKQTIDQLCHDKWHASWTYGAQRWLSVRSIHKAYPDTIRKLLFAILEREANGGWGQKLPTLEETAYIVSGIFSVLNSQELDLESNLRYQLIQALQRAQHFMVCELKREELKLPLIWISKNVYIPLHQVISAILDGYHNFAQIERLKQLKIESKFSATG